MIWATTSLGELATLAGGEVRTGPFGTQLHKRDYVDDPTATPVIMPKDMVDGRIETASIARVDDDVVNRLSQHILRAGDIVLGRRGEIGRRAWIGDTEDGWLCGTGSMRISLNNSKAIRPRFLFYYLGLQQSISWLNGHAVGATMSNLSAGVVKQMPVRYPPLTVQDMIVAALDQLDDLLENSRQRIEILEKTVRLLYREWFVHFGFPGHEYIELVDSELGPIPEDWSVSELSDLVSTQYGYTESATRDPVGPHYLRGMDINKNSYIDWSAVPFCPISDGNRQKFAIKIGDLFVIRMADPGKVGICEREVDGVFASYLVRMRPVDHRITSYYLFFALSDEPYQAWITRASTGATRQSVSAKVMTEPSLLVPPARVLAQFDAAVIPIRSLMSCLLEQNAVVREARGLLLPRLVSGELDVSEFGAELEAVQV